MTGDVSSYDFWQVQPIKNGVSSRTTPHWIPCPRRAPIWAYFIKQSATNRFCWPTPMDNVFLKTLSERDHDRIIEMAWEDRTPFEAIVAQFGLSEPQVIVLMRRALKPTSWRRWRQRVQGRATKHTVKSSEGMTRFKCDRQRAISRNRISKRN